MPVAELLMENQANPTPKKIKVAIMKTIKHTLLILLVSIFIISCANDGAYNEESNREMVKKRKAKKDSIKKAGEEASTFDINVDNVTHVWQRNILWFFYQKVSQ
jgi:hypothetical protein